MPAPADYDLNAVADALADVFDGVATGDEYNGVAETISAYADVPDDVTVPAVVLELATMSWDKTMGGGSDEFAFNLVCLVDAQDGTGSQRKLRQFLSRDSGGAGRLKAALEADQSLGGLVSYAHMSDVRDIGLISYAGADYLGVRILIEVES